MSQKKSRQTILNELRKLGQKQSSNEDLKKYQEQMYADINDRGSAILIATHVESTLESAIARIMIENRAEAMFETDPDLSTFNSKIWIGFALNLFGRDTFDTLKLIKHLRNAFAHSKAPIDFSTPEIVAACSLLPRASGLMFPPPPNGMSDIPPIHPERENFQNVCAYLSLRFSMSNVLGRLTIDRKDIGIGFDPSYTRVWATQEAIP